MEVVRYGNVSVMRASESPPRNMPNSLARRLTGCRVLCHLVRLVPLNVKSQDSRAKKVDVRF